MLQWVPDGALHPAVLAGQERGARVQRAAVAPCDDKAFLFSPPPMLDGGLKAGVAFRAVF